MRSKVNKRSMLIGVMGTFLLIGALTFMVVMFEVVGASEAEVHETIEGYEMETMPPNAEGHMKINSLTRITEDTKELLIYTISAVDYYDEEGNFIKTEVTVEEAVNDYYKGTIEKVTSNKGFNTPQTIRNLTSPQEFVDSNIVPLTAEDEQAIKAHLTELAKQNGFKTVTTSGRGITKEEQEKIDHMKLQFPR